MAYLYEKFVRAISRDKEARSEDELRQLGHWFSRKYDVMNSLKPESVLDVLKNLEFTTAKKDDVIILQGEEGDAFYVVLRGSVSVLLKESAEFTNREKETHRVHRDDLGIKITTLGGGKSFGELALIEEDSIRAASVVADEFTDLAVIHRDLYDRSVAPVVLREFQEKLGFVRRLPASCRWPERSKKHFAASLTRGHYGYGDVVVKQGDVADCMYFIIRGEVKLEAEPEFHREHFGEFMDKCRSLLTEDEQENPIKPNYRCLAKWLSPKSSRVIRLKSAPASSDDARRESEPCKRLTPSASRKRQAETRSNIQKHSICYLESGHMIGDVELLTALERHHATVVCTQDMTVMTLHKVFFDRWFRKKHPGSVKAMRRHLEAQVRRRAANAPGKRVPLLRSILMKLEALNGHRKVNRSASQFPTPNYGAKARSPPGIGIPKSGFQLQWSLLSPRGRHAARDSHVSLAVTSHPPDITQPEGGVETENPGKSEQTKPKSSIVLYGSLRKGSRKSDEEENQVCGNPGDGIYLKLRHVTYPGIQRHHLNMDVEEYNYLVALKRRLGKDIYRHDPRVYMQNMYTDSAHDRNTSNYEASGLPMLSQGVSTTQTSTFK